MCGLDAACKYVCVCTRLPMCDACYVALGCVLGRARTCKHIFIFIFISERCLHLRPLTSTASFCSTPSLAGTQQQQQFHLHQQECGSAAAAACVLCVYVCACVRVCPCATHASTWLFCFGKDTYIQAYFYLKYLYLNGAYISVH